MKIIKSIKEGLYFLNISKSFGVGKEEFSNEIYFLNYTRLRMFSIFLIILNIPLFLIDLNRLTDGIAHHLGSLFIFYSRIGIILLGMVYYTVLSVRNIRESENIKTIDKIFLNISFGLLFIMIILMTIGDELISGSIIVYFGALFTFAMVTILFNFFSFFIFFLSTAILFFVNGFFDIDPQLLLNQRINLVVFTIIVWFSSRYIFYLKIREFKNNRERETLISDLTSALKDVKLLSGLLPICSHCKMIRDDKGYWNQIESYIKEHSDAAFSHSICPDCHEKLYSKSDK